MNGNLKYSMLRIENLYINLLNSVNIAQYSKQGGFKDNVALYLLNFIMNFG